MTSHKLRICWLREQFPWMGQHSGYDLLCHYIKANDEQKHKNIYRTKLAIPVILQRTLNKLFSNLELSKTYDHNGLITEIRTLLHFIRKSYDITHVLYVERSLAILSKILKRKRGKLIGTVHQPVNLWKNGRHNTDLLSSLDALIILSKQDLKFFDELLPGRVHFIPHGIDTNFFKPLNETKFKIKKDNAPRCIFSGVWLRDTKSLATIVEKVLTIDSGFRFDILVPEDRRNNPGFDKISKYKQVFWHSNLSDFQLRSLYQNASMLLLPMLNCTANNALLEAIACGLPVVSNNISGIKDYTDKSFADLFPIGDIDSMTNAVLSLGGNPDKCRHRGLDARLFAENNFKWQISAAKTIDLYRTLLT
jgi:glycosyltransferase involved in cell wall biosynthesis